MFADSLKCRNAPRPLAELARSSTTNCCNGSQRTLNDDQRTSLAHADVRPVVESNGTRVLVDRLRSRTSRLVGCSHGRRRHNLLALEHRSARRLEQVTRKEAAMTEESFSETAKRTNAVIEARVRLLRRLAQLVGEEVDKEAVDWIETVATTSPSACREQAERWLQQWLAVCLDEHEGTLALGGLRAVEPRGQYYALPFPSLVLFRAANRTGNFIIKSFQGDASVSVRPYVFAETEEIGIMVELFTVDRANCLADVLLARTP